MGTGSSSPTTSVLFQDCASDNEERDVTLAWQADGTLCVRETTAGELTEAIFGCRSRHHEVHLSQHGVSLLEQVRPSQRASVILGEFFASGVAYLSDLMDELDGMGIAYLYTSYLSTGDAYFRPPCDRAR